jgi:aspartate/glutamate racemase
MLVNQLKSHAVDNYTSNGWDIMIETMSDSDIQDIISGCVDLNIAIEVMADYLQPIHEHREEIIATASW